MYWITSCPSTISGHFWSFTDWQDPLSRLCVDWFLSSHLVIGCFIMYPSAILHLYKTLISGKATSCNWLFLKLVLAILGPSPPSHRFKISLPQSMANYFLIFDWTAIKFINSCECLLYPVFSDYLVQGFLILALLVSTVGNSLLWRMYIEGCLAASLAWWPKMSQDIIKCPLRDKTVTDSEVLIWSVAKIFLIFLKVFIFI